MYTSEIQGCCSAAVIHNLGDAKHSIYNENYQDCAYEPETKKEFLEELKYRIAIQRGRGTGVVTAFTTDDQKMANEVLEEFGFQSTGWIEKANHRDTLLKMWWYITGEEKEE